MESQQQHSQPEQQPSGQQVLAAVLQLWESDPATELMGNVKLHSALKMRHPDWTLSSHRLKTVLKDFGLANQDLSTSPDSLHGLSDSIPAAGPDFQYSSQVVSELTPHHDLPEGVRVASTKTKGKCLYTTRKLGLGDQIWSESPFIVFPPLENIPLIRKSLACSYCGKPFPIRQHSNGEVVQDPQPLPGVDCRATDCGARWCTTSCRDNDSDRHGPCWHKRTRSGVTADQWIAFEKFCLVNELSTEYNFGLLLLSIMKDAKVQAQAKSMASIREDIRVQARRLDIMSSDTYASDKTKIWHQGHHMLAQLCKATDYDLTYHQYQMGLGMISINSLHGQLYLTESHINHSCDPNVEVIIPNDRTSEIQVRAIRGIGRGEELTCCYANMDDLDYYQRQYKLRINYGFLCNCYKCKEQAPAANADYNMIMHRPRRKSVRFDTTIETRS